MTMINLKKRGLLVTGSTRYPLKKKKEKEEGDGGRMEVEKSRRGRRIILTPSLAPYTKINSTCTLYLKVKR